MDARTANYLRVMKDPLNEPFTSNEKFNLRVCQQWNDYIVPDEKEVSFSTLKNLRRLYRGDKKLEPLLPSQFKDYL
jgi:hypothetical protein